MPFGRMPSPEEAMRQVSSQSAMFLAFAAVALLLAAYEALNGRTQSPLTILLALAGIAGVAGSVYRVSPLGRRRFLRGYERVYARMKQLSHDEIVRGTIQRTIRALLVLIVALAGEIAAAIALWSYVSWRPYTVAVSIATAVLMLAIGLGTFRWVRLGGPGAGDR